MLSYSIAIRTLGTGGDNYRRELESIARQTVQPERVIVYIAEGYHIPDFRIGREEYVAVPKGMAAQRALPYREISSDCILLLDDDVELKPDAAEHLLLAMERLDADCVAPDSFKNHLMAPLQKIREAIVNLALPSSSAKTALRIRRSGAVSYISSPEPGASYPSDRADGPASLWRRKALLDMHLENELWVEQDGFAYGEDTVTTHKLPVNGRRLFILFGDDATHLNSGNSSTAFRKGSKRMYIRSKNTFIIWWRCIYEPQPQASKIIAFAGRTTWNILVAASASIIKLRPSFLSQFITGLRDGMRYVRSDAYKNMPKYRL